MLMLMGMWWTLSSTLMAAPMQMMAQQAQAIEQMTHVTAEAADRQLMALGWVDEDDLPFI